MLYVNDSRQDRPGVLFSELIDCITIDYEPKIGLGVLSCLGFCFPILLYINEIYNIIV